MSMVDELLTLGQRNEMLFLADTMRTKKTWKTEIVFLQGRTFNFTK